VGRDRAAEARALLAASRPLRGKGAQGAGLAPRAQDGPAWSPPAGLPPLGCWFVAPNGRGGFTSPRRIVGVDWDDLGMNPRLKVDHIYADGSVRTVGRLPYGKAKVVVKGGFRVLPGDWEPGQKVPADLLLDPPGTHS
jgi:hypothetical protein